MQYKDARKPLPEIAQELGVQGVVEGSVFRAGDRVRITLQLIDARNDLHLWAQTYERDLSDVLALQSNVARAVAEQIRLKLTPEEQAALTTSRTVDPLAYDAYLRGLRLRGLTHLVMDWGPVAIKQFERSVELDPDFAEGWAALAGARHTLAVAGFDLRYRSEFPKAREAAERALEIDDHLGEAHAQLGWIQRGDWDFAGARCSFERALQLSPNDPGALNGYVWYLLIVEGKAEEALEYSERLLRVAPLDLTSREERLGHFFHARQYERGLEELERVRELAPDLVNLNIVALNSSLGRFEEAHRAHIAFAERCGAPCDWQREALERGWAEGGWEGSQRAWVEVATSIEGFPPFLIAISYTEIGETEDAFAWLERGYRERDPHMIYLKAFPAFDPLRSDPRYDDLVRRIGFPEE